MTQSDVDTWKPAALREAEAELDQTMRKARKLIKATEEKLKQYPDTDRTARPEDVARLKAAAERPDAPAAMRALKRKVDAGALSWKDVLEGKALQDPDVREAMRGRLGEMREIYQEAREGATLEEILEARGVTGSVFGGGGPTRPQSAPSEQPPSEDDYFAGNGFLTNRPPASPPPGGGWPPASGPGQSPSGPGRPGPGQPGPGRPPSGPGRPGPGQPGPGQPPSGSGRPVPGRPHPGAGRPPAPPSGRPASDAPGRPSGPPPPLPPDS
ncbi:hypothetical protein, partial [Amycolatopsis acidiphila]